MISDTIQYVLDNSPHGYIPEYQFDKYYGKRLFRADFAILKFGILIEAEGIGGYQSRHTSITGYNKDTEKYNLAAILGFNVLRYTTLSDDADKIESDINKLITRIEKYNKHKQLCNQCKEPFYITPRLWLRTSGEKLNYICLVCNYLNEQNQILIQKEQKLIRAELRKQNKLKKLSAPIHKKKLK